MEYVIGHYDAPGKNAVAEIPLPVQMRFLCPSFSAAQDTLINCATADCETFKQTEFQAPVKFNLADTEPLETFTESAYVLRWVEKLQVTGKDQAEPENSTACLYLVRKKPDGYVFSGPVRIRALRYYIVSQIAPAESTSAEPAQESSSSSSDSSSTDSSDEASEDPVCPCGKQTVHFHSAKDVLTGSSQAIPPSGNEKVWTAAPARRRRNRNRNRKSHKD